MNKPPLLQVRPACPPTPPLRPRQLIPANRDGSLWAEFAVVVPARGTYGLALVSSRFDLVELGEY